MKNLLLLILALSLFFGCVQETPAAQNDVPAVANDSQPIENDSAAEPDGAQPAENDSAGLPADNGSAITSPPDFTTVVALEVNLTEIELTTGTREVRKPNPECYPDAQKCGMMDEPMHIFEEKEDIFYNLSSVGDECLLAQSSAGSGEAVYLVEYSFTNNDLKSHKVDPMIIIMSNKKDYLITSPYSETACSSFLNEQGNVTLDGFKSREFKATVAIPESESMIAASYYVDGVQKQASG